MKKYLNTTIIAMGVIISSIILGDAWKRTHIGGETISVTGMASKDFTSDLIVWKGSFTSEFLPKKLIRRLKKTVKSLKNISFQKG